MTIGKVLEINCETGETTERDLTPEEIQQSEENAKAEAERIAIEKAEAESKAAAKAAALAKLSALGLTEEEAKAIAG